MIQLTIPTNDFLDLIQRQVSSFFPFAKVDRDVVLSQLDRVFERMDICLRSRINGYMNDLSGGGRFA